MKQCSKCKATKSFEDFPRRAGAKDGLRASCKECISEYQREWRSSNHERELRRGLEYREANRERKREYQRGWRKTNPEHHRGWVNENPEYYRAYFEANHERKLEIQRKHRDSIRQLVFDHYGNECARCGSVDRLELDHINDDGGRHRKELGLGPRAGSAFYQRLVSSGFDTGDYELQTLCHECHKRKTFKPKTKKKGGG